MMQSYIKSRKDEKEMCRTLFLIHIKTNLIRLLITQHLFRQGQFGFSA